MSENNNDKTTGKKTLTLKRSVLETSTVKQNFSHGRTKAVVVETKRRKITRPDEKLKYNSLLQNRMLHPSALNPVLRKKPQNLWPKAIFHRLRWKQDFAP